ncbi:MAG: alkaline phosphatase family protein [Phycisphaerales bacterium]|nr:MAG: alkaline phosphatase family protein [Phycisphaerales bacterium]
MIHGLRSYMMRIEANRFHVFLATLVLAGFVFSLMLAGERATAYAEVATAEERSDTPRRTILWLSIDGIRPDYIGRAETPTMDRMAQEGAYSTQFVPVYPSLTFPSHVSKATGTKVREHGVPGNSFIDAESGRMHRYPWNPELLGSEPIWTTAKRQGVRVAVYDWPLSHSQKGDYATDYHGERYIRGLSDSQRLDQLFDAWEKDLREREEEEEKREPLRLLMGYIVGPDSLGHQHGPDAQPPIDKLGEVDLLLRSVMTRALRLFEHTRQDNDELIVMLTTDHGMSEVHSLVNINYLADLEGVRNVETVTSGNTGHIFIQDPDDSLSDRDRQAKVRELVQRINQHDFARAFARDDAPEQWQINHPTRTGDVFVNLEKGYTFSSRPRGVTGPARELGGPLGMHGYDPRETDEMNGIMIVWRYPGKIGGVDLGRVHATQLHATVAQWLDIEPAEKAREEPVRVQPRLRRR